MNDVKITKVGQLVYYYPNGFDAHCEYNNAKVLPATIVQVFGSHLNLAVTCMNPDGPVVLRYSISHLSTVGIVPGTENTPAGRYWDYPPTE